MRWNRSTKSWGLWAFRRIRICLRKWFWRCRSCNGRATASIFGRAFRTTRDCVPELCKFVSVVNVGRSWKPRLVVITDQFVRVMRDLDCNETKTEQPKEDLGAAVLCNSGKVFNRD